MNVPGIYIMDLIMTHLKVNLIISGQLLEPNRTATLYIIILYLSFQHHYSSL